MECFFTAENGTATPAPCNNVVGSPNLFTGGVEYTDYGYEPNHAATYAFVAVYGAGFLAQLLIGIYWRCWWTLPTLAAGALIETLGWAGRVWSIVAWEWTPNEGGTWSTSFGSFIMQICCLVIGPTFFSAANYILLGRLMASTGGRYSTLHPKSFSIMFIIADVISLFVQAAGGGIAGTADDSAGSDNGAYIMTGGVIFQLVITVIYSGLFFEWLWRRRNDRPVRRQFNPFSRRSKAQSASSNGPVTRDHTLTNDDITLTSRNGSSDNQTQLLAKPEDGSYPFATGSGTSSGAQGLDEAGTVPYELEGRKVTMMTWLIVAGTFLIVVRSVYRAIELTDGWSGPIATNEPLFLGMDALLMALFVWLYVVVNPGIAFGKRMF